MFVVVVVKVNPGLWHKHTAGGFLVPSAQVTAVCVYRPNHTESSNVRLFSWTIQEKLQIVGDSPF